MHNKNHYVLIMAGGIGSRFWPVSRKSLPKQFIDIMGTGDSLITQTFNRFADFVPEENIFIVTNQEYVEMVKTHIPSILPDRILAEPQARNTAPCIAYASQRIKAINPDAVCVVAPSDHLITNEKEFKRIIEAGYNFATEFSNLVTLGIKPTRPDTGYGYIQFNMIPTSGQFHEVKTFTEKPTLEIAKTFIESGEFLWNAGIFIWHIDTILNRLEALLPEVHQLFAEIDFSKPGYEDELEKAYGFCPSISIDYGVLEKDPGVYVIPATFGWNDLGTWKSLWDVQEKDEQGNVSVGKNVIMLNTKDSLVFNSDSKRFIITTGVENVVVVDSGDVVLIMNKDQEQELRKVVNHMRDEFKGRFT